MANSADPDQLASSLIWIDTICKGRVYPGSAGQELMANSADPEKPTDLDLHCLQRQGISGFSRTRVKKKIVFSLWPLIKQATFGN